MILLRWQMIQTGSRDTFYHYERHSHNKSYTWWVMASKNWIFQKNLSKNWLTWRSRTAFWWPRMSATSIGVWFDESTILAEAFAQSRSLKKYPKNEQTSGLPGDKQYCREKQLYAAGSRFWLCHQNWALEAKRRQEVGEVKERHFCRQRHRY